MTHDERVAKIDEYLEDLTFVHMTGTQTNFGIEPCDTCRQNKAGPRYEWTAHIEQGPWQEWITFKACTPCTFELAYPGEQDSSD